MWRWICCYQYHTRNHANTKEVTSAVRSFLCSMSAATNTKPAPLCVSTRQWPTAPFLIPCDFILQWECAAVGVSMDS